MTGDGGDRLVRSGICADDIAVAEVVVVAGDCPQHFRILAKHAGDLVDGVKLRDGGHHAASACGLAIGTQFHGSNSSRRLIL